MPTTLFYWPRSSATRVHWALEELGIPYDKKRLNREKGENKTPEYLAISPMGNVPALVEDGRPIFESLAILIHLGQKYGTEKGLWPKVGSPDESEALSWTVWSHAEFLPPRLELMKHTLDSPFALPKELKNPAIAERARKAIFERVALLEKRLGGGEWLLGKSFSLVDVSLAAWANTTQSMLGLSLADYPGVMAWVARCMARPAFQRVMSET